MLYFYCSKRNLGAFIVTNQSGENTAYVMEETLNEIFEKIANAFTKIDTF